MAYLSFLLEFMVGLHHHDTPLLFHPSPTFADSSKELPIDRDASGKPEISPSRVFRIFKDWLHSGVFAKIFGESVQRLLKDGRFDLSIIHGDGTTTAAKKGGDMIGHNGHKNIKGEKVVAFVDRLCNVLCPFTIAPGNASEMTLLPEALKDLKVFLKKMGISLKGVIASFDSGYDSKANRKKIFNAGMTPNIKENPRNRKKPKSGRKRLYSEEIFKERFKTVERVFAWEGEWASGTSPPASRRTGREPLDSSGPHHSAISGFALFTSSSRFRLTLKQSRMTQPLDSISITETSSLLRASPPLFFASVLSSL